ncbi:MAG: CAP domain-containing protein [Hyphomicrobiaceae bacterium]
MADLPDLAKTELAIVERTNQFRKEQGLGQVRRNRALDRAAQSFARYLAKSGKFAHEADGRQPAERAKAAGYWYCAIAENLALNLDSRGFTVEKLSRDTVEGWKASPGHRKNLMLAGVTETGVGIAQAPAGHPKFLSVQLLARPSSLAYEFTVANKSSTSVSYAFAGRTHEAPPRSVATHKVCEPGKLAFTRSGGWLLGGSLDAEFAVSRKAAFVIENGSDGKLRVTEQK